MKEVTILLRRAVWNIWEFRRWWEDCKIGNEFMFGMDKQIVIHWKAAYNRVIYK